MLSSPGSLSPCLPVDGDVPLGGRPAVGGGRRCPVLYPPATAAPGIQADRRSLTFDPACNGRKGFGVCVGAVKRCICLSLFMGERRLNVC